jgi:Ca2+-binding EF-hand superfamily protein
MAIQNYGLNYVGQTSHQIHDMECSPLNVSEVTNPKETIKGGVIGTIIALFLLMIGESSLGGICCMGSIFVLFAGIVQQSNQAVNTKLEEQSNQAVNTKLEAVNTDPLGGLTWAEDANGNWGWLENIDAEAIDARASEITEQINISPEVISALQKTNGDLGSLSTNELKSFSTSLGMGTSNREIMVNNINDSQAGNKIIKGALTAVAAGGAITATGVAIAAKRELAKKSLNSVGKRINSIDDVDTWLKSSGINANELVALIDPDGSGAVDAAEFAAFTKMHTGTIIPSWMVKQIFDKIEPGNRGTISIAAMLAHLESIGIEIEKPEVEDSIADGSDEGSDQFRVGDRLEAVVLGHPDTIAVASIIAIEGDNLTIHFDGWNSNHDYTTTADDLDIRPVGTQEARGEELHPPYRHVGEFDWNQYLAQIGARAAPEAAFSTAKESEESDLEEINTEEEVETENEVETEDEVEEVETEDEVEEVETENEVDDDDDDDDDDEYGGIDSKLELIIEELNVTKLRGEREQLILEKNSTFKSYLKIISIQRTLIAEGDYRGGNTATALLDGGPFTAKFQFKLADSANLSEISSNSDVKVLCELLDYQSAIKSAQLLVTRILD